MSVTGFRPVADGPFVPVQRVTKNAGIIATRRAEVALQGGDNIIAKNGAICGIRSGVIRAAIRPLQNRSIGPIIYIP
jgi:hypothetical protein